LGTRLGRPQKIRDNEMTAPPQGAALSKPPSLRAGDANSKESPRFGKRRSLGLLLLVAVCLAGLIDWLSATTQRLYVDEDSAASQQQGTVWQHFALRGHEVVPEIISADDARFTFPLSLSSRQTLRFTAYPDGEAAYEIFLVTAGTSRQLAARKLDRPESDRISIPAGNAELKFVIHGRIAWFDLRLTRQFHWPVYLVLSVLALLALAKTRIPHPGTRIPHPAGNWLALGLSTLICLCLIECVLRLFALKLPPAILTARHDLGLAAPDPRWIDSPRYKQRLRPNLKTFCEWEYGDIVRMGFLPRELFGGEPHRYPFETDSEGFRNPAVRSQVDVAALGDSFVDAMTSPREEAWPARLEQITGKRVQNYGTSSYGPQQELYVLKDFAIAHRPRDVVLAYFAGNDLFDAERFDDWQGVGDKPGDETAGWRLKKNYRRFETLYLTTLAKRVLPVRATSVSQNSARAVDFGFDRGAYETPTPNGTPLRFALMPPYLQKLVAGRAEIEGSRGWRLVCDSLSRMKEICEQHDSRLTVLFVPSKDEVYWPLIERSLGQEELQRSVDFISSYNHMRIRVADIQANRLVQNDLMREFCVSAGIRFLDLTPALEQAAASGRAVYFADDAHWNAAGHEIAARELARLLAERP
jgi:lysophospholipase L1-like esterase